MDGWRMAASPTDTKKQRKTKDKADELGVCLIGKRESPSKVVPLCSGCLLRGLFPRCEEKLYIITSGDIDRSEWKNCILYCQRWDTDKPYDDKLKEYALPHIWKSEKGIEFIQGLSIIPIDAKKLGEGSFSSFIRRRGSSGMLTYRPYPVKFEEYDTGSLAGSFCQIVDGGTSGFAVKTFVLEYMSGKYVLKLPEKRDVFKTRSEVTGGGSNSLHPRGAVILRRQGQEDQRSLAVAVLKFVNDEICPVPLSQISGLTNNQKEKEAEKSAVETEHEEEEEEEEQEEEEQEEEEEGKAPTDHKALSGNGERRSSKDAVAVQTPAHDASAVHGKAPLIVTGRIKYAPKLAINAATNLDGVTSNEASGRECNGGSNEPESNNEPPVSASAGQASQHQAALTESTNTAATSEHAGKQEKHKENENIRPGERLTRLKQGASDEGYTIVDNEGSGNCMFHALADQLELVKELHLTHLQVRQSLVEFLKKNPQWAKLYEFVRHRYPSWDNYLLEMEQDGTWGDNLMLKAAADHYQTTIYVISSESRKHDRTISPEKDSNSKRLVLGHVCELHYVSLRPTPDSVKPPGDSKSSPVDDGEAVKQERVTARRAAGNSISLPAVTDSLDQISELLSTPSSPDEKTYASILKNLLKEGGTAALRGVFSKIHPPENLKENLFASVLCLGSLLHQGILSKRQWDKLFPPDGSEPDANTFDLILLFILLTNISGEPPPPPTWHYNPPQRHKALVAVLARFRLLHDKLCTTGVSIDKRRFSALWQEISAVLLDLGLEQSEIDGLKKPCREEQYPDVLIGWVYRKHQNEPHKDDFCREKEKPPPTMEQFVQEILQVVTSTQEMIRGSVIKCKQDASTSTEELQRESETKSTSVQTEPVQGRDSQTLRETVSTEEHLDALPERLDDDDESFDGIDDDDGGGFLHYLFMLLFSVVLSSVLTYCLCMFS